MSLHRKRRPGIDRAREFVLKTIHSRALRAGDALPSVRQLSSEAGVAFATMWRALRQCADDGLLWSRPGCPYRVKTLDGGGLSAERESASPASVSLPTAWHRVRFRIEKDILNGVYPPGRELPSIKELRYRYRVAYETLKKALSALCESGVLQPSHRTYLVPARGQSSSRASIVLLGHRSQAGGVDFSEASSDFHRIFERECAGRNIDLIVETWGFRDDNIVFYDSHDNARAVGWDDTTVMGYVVVAAEPEHYPRRAIRRLLARNKPVCVLDEIGNEPLPSAGLLRRFSGTASGEPGREIARYLISRGHTSIAYVSPFHHRYWSRIRCKGLRETFHTAGFTDGVKECTTVSRYPDSAEKIFPRIARKQCDTEPLRRFNARWRKEIPADFAREMDDLIDNIHERLFTPVVFRRITAELFAQARTFPGVSCWVTANDKIGLQALEYLRNQGVSVPRDISVVGFDNTREALAADLTSFDFNLPAIVHTMLDHIVNYDGWKRRDRIRREVEGVLIERGSSGGAVTGQ